MSGMLNHFYTELTFFYNDTSPLLLLKKKQTCVMILLMLFVTLRTKVPFCGFILTKC